MLCVDDEPKILQGLELQLGFDYEVRTATSGRDGLTSLRAHPNCAVIISDMRMPEMNGAQFLAASRDIAPDTTRMLLTGFSDISDAISAINDGGIFRFLTKPIGPDALKQAVADARRQWELVRSERVLLEQTLHGAAQALVEALEIASPSAFARVRRIESACRHVAIELRMEPVWEMALAGLLVRLGWIAIPTETVDGYLKGSDLNSAEVQMFEDAFATSVGLVGQIPRLDGVAAIIGEARQPTYGIDRPTVLRAVCDFDERCYRGHGAAKAIKGLEGAYPPEVLAALGSWDGANEDSVVRQVKLSGVVPGMAAETDIVTLSGNLLVKAGTDLTETVIRRLHNFAARQGVQEPITVSTRA